MNIDNNYSECTDEVISYTSGKELSLIAVTDNTISNDEAHCDTENICNIVSSAFSRDNNKSESNTSQTEALLHIDMRFYVKIVIHPAMAIVKNIKYSKNDRTAEY